MPFETLKRSHLKRNIIIGVVVVLIISAIVLNFTRAKYRVTESIPLVNGTINYSPGDIIISAYFNDELLESFPTKDSGYTVESITCDNEATATFDEGMYAAEDNLGTSYYFRGGVTNNYISFAGYYWRIIRINGDGSIRLIYDGTEAHENGESSNNRQLEETSAFNSDPSESYYVGYTYQPGAQRPSTQNGGTSSTIKGMLDSWYSSNLSIYDSWIVNTPGFCNDRNTASGYTWASSGATFYYIAYDRLVSDKTPSLQCNETSDLYTTKVGLITADEALFAGLTYISSNRNNYLFSGTHYRTITPYASSNGRAQAFIVSTSGDIRIDDGVSDSFGVRPVINLSADVTLTGTGTMNDPYVVEGA